MHDELILARVAARRTLADDIIELRLERADGTALPAFEAGAHLDLEVQPGSLRPYSLCSTPGTGEHCVAILRAADGRGGSIAAHDRLQAGAEVRVSAPRNHFALAPGGGPALLLAGGIGITPLLAMARALHVAGRPFELFYCARSRGRAAFLPEIAASAWHPRARLFFDDESHGGGFDPAAQLTERRDTGADVYVCGPGGFMAWAVAGARAAGYPEERIHLEHFTAAPAAQPPAGERSFEVRLQRRGITLQVPADHSIAEMLEARGVAVNLSCEAGVCGSCMTRVLEGLPDHRDTVLTAAQRAAGDRMTVCCSRSHSASLVLDL